MLNFQCILNNIIGGKCDQYCCLCLNVLDEPAAILQDEIFLENTSNSMEIADILKKLFDTDVLHFLTPKNAICKQCFRSAVDSFLFVEKCRENCNNLENIIRSIYNSTNTVGKLHNCNSIFIKINPADFSSQTCYSNQKPILNNESMLKRYKTLLSNASAPKIKLETEELTLDQTSGTPENNVDDDDIATVNKVKVKKLYTKVEIPTSEMMCENNSLKCNQCFKIYSSKQHLRQHFIRVHVPKKFPCEECNRSYSTKAILDQHKHECHTPAICSQCGKTYKNLFTLANHEQGHKTKIICPDCGRMYKNRKTFNQHLEMKICQQKERKSNLQGKYICDFCGKKFSHKGTLRVHIKFEHGTGEPHVCPWCSKKFYAESRLKAHVVKHTQEKKFFCDICGGKFVTKESLLYHTRIHTGEQPYSCDLCDQKFISSSRRAAHLRRHMVASYECEICHSKFKEKAWLLKHKKRHFNPKSRLHRSGKDRET